MDNRDMDLIELLESGEAIPEEKLRRLVYTMSDRPLGPSTIEGKSIALMDPNDMRVKKLNARIKLAELRALLHLRLTIWYVHNAWPPLPDTWKPQVRFRTWVDLRLSEYPDQLIQPVYAWKSGSMRGIN
jgi:hypothetical protein